MCHKLAWFGFYNTVVEAIAMEKRIKHWRRAWKDELIEKLDPDWKDMSEDWYHERDLEK